MSKTDDRFIAVVPVLPFSCPKCGAFKPRTYSQGRDKLVRYHQCGDCRQKYRSYQIERAEIRDWLVREADDEVPFLPPQCPTCRSHSQRTSSVNTSPHVATMRYHECKNCGERYKSVQIGRDEMQKWMPDADRRELGRS